MSLSSENRELLSLENLKGLKNIRITIVCTEWNEKIVAEQIKGAQRIFEQLNISNIEYYKVPGAFEIPFACKRLMDRLSPPDAIITFGAVIRGGTPHFEYVCKALVEGITMLQVKSFIPLIFGVLTLDNDEQAWERLGGKHGHKGEEAAIAALKMIKFNKAI